MNSNKTEIILREGNFIRRSTETTEDIIGDAAVLLAKHIPKKPINIDNAFSVNWRGEQAKVNLAIKENILYCFVHAPSVGPKCVWRPILNADGAQMFINWEGLDINTKTKIQKDLTPYIDGWAPVFDQILPSRRFDKIAQFSLKWDTLKNGPTYFIVSLTEVSPRQYALGDCFFINKSTKGISAFFMPNHYDNGAVCMGDKYREELHGNLKETRGIAELTQLAVDSYNTTINNMHLYKTEMSKVWTLDKKMDDLKDNLRISDVCPTLTSLAFTEGIL